MDAVSRALEEKCGAKDSSIQHSIIETAKILDISTLQVCTALLEETASYRLKIISWNCLADIWHGDRGKPGRDRFRRVLSTLQKMIETYDPDVIMLQEVTRAKYLILENTFENYVSYISYHSKQHWHSQLKLPYQPNGTCIFVKKYLEPLIFSTVSLGGGNFGSALVVSIPPNSADAEKPTRIHISNVHLNDMDVHHIREREVSKILEMLNPNTVYVIGGDLNSPPNGEVHKVLSNAGFETTCFKGCKIDYIYVKKGGQKQILMVPLMIEDPSTSVETLIRKKGSDHPPIGVEIFLF